MTPAALAGVLLDVSGIYLSDSLVTPTNRTSSQMYYGLGALLDLKKNLWVGWNYSGFSQSQTVSTTTTFTSTDMGLGIKWQVGRSKLYNIGAAYNFLAKGVYSDGTTTENWEGTSFLLSFGVAPEVSERLFLGVSLNYYSATYTKKIVSSVESSASNSKSWIFPMFSISKEW